LTMGCGATKASDAELEALKAENEKLKAQLSAPQLSTPQAKPPVDAAAAEDPAAAKAALRKKRMSMNDVDLSKVEVDSSMYNEEPSTVVPEGGDVEVEDFEFECVNMDVPKKARMKSSLCAEDLIAGDAPPSVSPASPPSAVLNQQRFRKKSVNMCADEPDEKSLAVVVELGQIYDDRAKEGLMTKAQLIQQLTSRYKPSESENNFLLMWFDFTGDNKVSFDEYNVVLASVLKDAGLTAECGVDQAREQLMSNVERVMEELAEGGGGETRNRTGAVGKYLDSRAYGPEVIEQAKTELAGLDLRPKFDEADLDKDGSLSSTELAKFIQVSYRPSVKRATKLLRYFDFSGDETVDKQSFVSGMVNLAEDYIGFRSS